MDGVKVKIKIIGIEAVDSQHYCRIGLQELLMNNDNFGLMIGLYIMVERRVDGVKVKIKIIGIESIDHFHRIGRVVGWIAKIIDE